MSIKLLPKSELANLKAKEKTREVQEGVKIATRVDGLRELWSKTESDFEIYKTSTLSAIQKEIEALTNKRDKVYEELRQMQSKYDSLMPEIKFKRSELAQFEKSLTAWEKKLSKREDDAALLEIDVLEAKKKAEDAEMRSEENERISRNLLIQSEQKKASAENALTTACTIHDKAYQDKKEIEAALELREISIKTKEKELLSKELSLTNFEKELRDEKIRTNDLKETLMRSLQRIKEGRHP